MNYQTDGCYLFKQILPLNLLDQINSEIFAIMPDPFQMSFEDFRAAANISQYLVSVAQLGVCKPLIDAIRSIGITVPVLNTRPLVSYSDKRLAKNEMYWKVPAHQDWPSMQGSIDGLTAWIPLVPLDATMGFLEVIPGSHLNGVLPQKNDTLLEDNFDGQFIPIEMTRGDVLVFSTFLVHKSGINESNKIRLTAHYRFDNLQEPSFVKRSYPHHRIDKRGEGILYPDLDTKNLVQDVFKSLNNS